MISDNPKVSLGNVDCSLYTRRIALEDDYHKKTTDLLAYTPVEFNFLKTLAKTLIIPACQSQFIQENTFSTATFRRIAIAMNTNSAFTGSCTENRFCYLQFDLRQNGITRGSQPIVDFDGAYNCRLNVTTKKGMNFQNDVPSIPIVDFKDHYVLMFDLTSMQETTESCHYPKFNGESLRLKLNFIFSLQHLAKRCVGRPNVFGCSWQVWCSWENFPKWIMSLSRK